MTALLSEWLRAFLLAVGPFQIVSSTCRQSFAGSFYTGREELAGRSGQGSQTTGNERNSSQPKVQEKVCQGYHAKQSWNWAMNLEFNWLLSL